MIEAALGLLGGWLITHLYYRKSNKETPDWAKSLIAQFPDKPPTIDELIDRRLEEKRERLNQLLEGDFQQIEFDNAEDVSDEHDEEHDFELLITFLRKQAIATSK